MTAGTLSKKMGNKECSKFWFYSTAKITRLYRVDFLVIKPIENVMYAFPVNTKKS
jgi:hypothetical protein